MADLEYDADGRLIKWSKRGIICRTEVPVRALIEGGYALEDGWREHGWLNLLKATDAGLEDAPVMIYFEIATV